MGIFRYGDAPKTTCYTHRNGEMDAPTETGRYFFFGAIDNAPTFEIAPGEDEPMQHWMDLVDVARYPLTEKIEAMLLFPAALKNNSVPLTNFRGQWWGPIIEPWRVVKKATVTE